MFMLIYKTSPFCGIAKDKQEQISVECCAIKISYTYVTLYKITQFSANFLVPSTSKLVNVYTIHPVLQMENYTLKTNFVTLY